MIPSDVRGAVNKALYLLPHQMHTPEARVMIYAIGLQRRKIKRPEQARQRLPGLTTNQPVSEVRLMADANSIPAPVARSKNGTPLYECVCPDCGVVRLNDKRKLGSRCHPCAGKLRVTHGMSGTPLFNLLMNVRARCEQPSATHYCYYGGRGIKVCDEWVKDPRAFAAWAEQNGYQKGLELDRKDVNGPYAPWNCRFVDHKTNSRGRRKTICNLEMASKVKSLLRDGLSLKETAKTVGLPYMVVWHISKGNSWTDAP